MTMIDNERDTKGTTTDLVRWAPVVFVTATVIGLAMRLMEIGWTGPAPFDHLLHAHSHALYFGWAGFVILTATTSRRPRSLADPVWWALVLVPVMTVTFLWGGYWPASIAASSMVMLAWYAAIATWWRNSRVDRSPLVGIERTGFAYVLVASVGIWVLAPLQAFDLGPDLASRLAIHAFLSTFAWFFVIGTVGAAVRGGLADPAVSRRVVRWLGALAWLTFPLGVAGGPEVPALGAVARIAGVVLTVPLVWWVAHLWKQAGARPVRWPIRWATVWLGIAGLGLAAVGLGGSAVLEAAGRHGIVLYLHALLLGYVTSMLAWYLASTTKTDIRRPLSLHHAGVATMLVGLAGAALAGSWYQPGQWLAALGAAVTWGAGLSWARAIWVGRR